MTVIAALSPAYPVMADQILQQCRAVGRAQETFSQPVREYMQRNKEVVVRVCRQIDFNTETYYALEPVTKRGNVCRYTAARISPATGKVTAESPYMAWVTDRCPSQESPRYVSTNNVSEPDFANIAEFFDGIASSKQAFASAIADLPHDQRESRELLELRRQINRTGRAPIVRIFELQSILGIRSLFEVHIANSHEDDRFYALRVRKLFGHLSLVEFAEGGS